MELSETQIAEIHLYLAGDLQGERLAALEMRIREDAAFAREVEMYRGLETVARGGRREALQAEIAAAATQADREQGIRRVRLWWAVALLILLIPLGYWIIFSGASSQSLCEEYSSLYLKGGPDRSVGQSQSPYAKAWDQYRAGQHQAALGYFDAVPLLDSNYWQIQIYRGISLKEMGDHAGAVEVFNEVLAQPDGDFQDLASWYLSLTHLCKGDIPETLQALRNHLNAGYSYKRNEVMAMIEELE